MNGACYSFVLMIGLTVLGSPLSAQEIDFGRDIRPILSNTCVSCHGPDQEARQADLRIDLRESLFGPRDGQPLIVPGKRAESLLWQRISSKDPDVRMPPPESNRSLTGTQIERLGEWIDSGAAWERHWSFERPRRPEVPSPDGSLWPRNPIDHFILARLNAAGLEPSAPADALTLVRRLYLDLTGLPPTPDAADRWLSRLLPTGAEETLNHEAVEQLVDELMDSADYGERWARRWLDLARYADTNGYEKDRERQIWPYRDWVVDAMNRGMPFDRFTIEQLAGDMLPDAGESQRVATGFHRNSMLNEEGGIDPLEFRFHAMTDRVATTGTVWLGLTIGCAQCHTHKYDPVSHTDYYGLMAFLNNADEREIELADAQLEKKYRDALAQAKQLIRELPRHWPVDQSEADPALTRQRRVEAAFLAWWKQEREQLVHWRTVSPTEAGSNLPLVTVEDNDTVFVSGDTTKQDEIELSLPSGDLPVTALRLEALPDPRLPDHGPGLTYYEGTKGDFFLGEFEVLVDGKRVGVASASHSYAKNRFGNNPVSAELATDGDPQTGWSVAGRLGERHVAVFVLENPIPADAVFQIRMLFGRHYASTLGKFRLSLTDATNNPKARPWTREVAEWLGRMPDQLSPESRQNLQDVFLMNAPELAKKTSAIRKLQSRPRFPRTLVFQERPAEHPRPTFRHHRGEYLQPREAVAAHLPAVLPPLPVGQVSDRLGFARWLVSPENPLTARVVMNRQWAALFGRGLVRTVGDFGLQGDPPSHPELLDWLAVEFMESGWSLKHMHRLMVLSAAYRQSAAATPEQLAMDGDNLWFGRASRFRLDAEIIRDAALQASGLLSKKRGGPPVRPSQSAGVTEVAFGSPRWNPSAGSDRFRRSLYTFQKRTAPFALFQTFDGPSGESCIARRDRSNTALQALSLLNDVVFVEAAHALGRRVADLEGDETTRIQFAFRQVLTRTPDEEETQQMIDFTHRQRTRLLAGELDTLQLGAVKTASPDQRVEQAVWSTLARALFGLDEAITRN